MACSVRDHGALSGDVWTTTVLPVQLPQACGRSSPLPPKVFQLFQPPNLMRRHQFPSGSYTARATSRPPFPRPSLDLHRYTNISKSARDTADTVTASVGTRDRRMEEPCAQLILNCARHKTFFDCPLHIKKCTQGKYCYI